MGINHFCFFPVYLMHLFNCSSATPDWAVFPDVKALLCSFKRSSMVLPVWPMYTFEQEPHTGFGKPHQLFAVGVCGPSASPTSVKVCGGAGRMCESRVGPISFRWSQIDDGRTVG